MLYPREVSVVNRTPAKVCLLTWTTAQYGCGAKLILKVVVAIVLVLDMHHAVPLLPEHSGYRAISLDGGGSVVMSRLFPEPSLPQYTLLLCQLESVEVPNAPLASQYNAHSEPVSAAYTAYCDCVAVADRSISRAVRSYIASPTASESDATNMAKKIVNPRFVFIVMGQ